MATSSLGLQSPSPSPSPFSQMPSSSSSPISHRGIRILSLDGGGVRGLSSLLILQTIITELSQQIQSPTTLLPCEVFDLIIGTSTGGILALMLGRLRMSVEDCICEYVRLAKAVFDSPWRFRVLLGKPMYSARALENAMQDLIEKRLGQKNSPLVNGEGCKTAVVAALQAAGNIPVLFKSYDSSLNCTIWEAARATSAACLFFPPISIGSPERTYIDGALSGFCNPASLGLLEAGKLWPNRSITTLLSVGTGSPSTIPVEGSLRAIVESVGAIATECNKFDVILRRQLGNGPGSPYFRFSVRGEIAGIRLDEWKEISNDGGTRLSSLTDNYMRSDEQREQIDRLLRNFSAVSQTVEYVCSFTF
jgi:hypothetical protein